MSAAFEILVGGLFLGGLYALFGLGLSLIFGVMRIANIAHGELAIAGAFAMLVLSQSVPVHPFILVPVILMISFGIGWVLQSALIDRVLSPDPMPTLLVTFGLSVVLQNLLTEIFGANTQSIDIGAFKEASFAIAGFSFGLFPLSIFALSLTLFLVLQWTLSFTKIGRRIRATSELPELVSLFGVRRKQINAIVMGIAVATAALAGMMLAVRSSFTPFSGTERLLIAFEVVVIGGLGSIWATFIGGIALAVVHMAGFYFDPASGLLYGHILLLVFLLVRPQGIAGRVASR